MEDGVGMYGEAPDGVDPRVSWRSVTAGFVLHAALFVVLVAASYPLSTVLLLATGAALYGLRWVLRRATYERTFRFCRAGFCLHLQLRVG